MDAQEVGKALWDTEPRWTWRVRDGYPEAQWGVAAVNFAHLGDIVT